MVCAMLYNANRRKGQKAVKPEDFMPRPRRSQAAIDATNALRLQLAVARMKQAAEANGNG